MNYPDLKIEREDDFADGRIVTVHKIKGFLCLREREGVGDRIV